LSTEKEGREEVPAALDQFVRWERKWDRGHAELFGGPHSWF